MSAARDPVAIVAVLTEWANTDDIKARLSRLMERLAYWAPEEEHRIWAELHAILSDWFGPAPVATSALDIRGVMAMALYSGRSAAVLIGLGALSPEWVDLLEQADWPSECARKVACGNETYTVTIGERFFIANELISCSRNKSAAEATAAATQADLDEAEDDDRQERLARDQARV